jgi:O-antigen/teichoic acid export membrane protein
VDSLLLMLQRWGPLFSWEIVRVMADPVSAGAGRVIPIVAFTLVLCGIGFSGRADMFLAKSALLLGLVSVAAVLNPVLNAVLVPSFGMLGATWATFGEFPRHHCRALLALVWSRWAIYRFGFACSRECGSVVATGIVFMGIYPVLL